MELSSWEAEVFLKTWVLPVGLFSFYFTQSSRKRQMLDCWQCRKCDKKTTVNV